MATDQYSLRWNNYSKHISSTLDVLREDSHFVDVTLSCKGKKIKAHKIILSACSIYFRDLFKENPCPHPVIIFENVKFDNLRAVINFMYQGEVNIRQEQLASFMLTAELLAVEGLTGASADYLAETRDDEENSMPPPEPETQLGKSQSEDFQSSENLEPSTSRKRRWASNSNNSSKRRANGEQDSNEREQESTFSPQHTSENSDDRVEFIPINPQVKVEMPEFVDSESVHEHFDSGQDVDNIPSLLGHSMGSSDSTGDVMELYSGKSEESNQLTGETMTPAELSQVLSKAGPSGESAVQDSLQEGDVIINGALNRGQDLEEATASGSFLESELAQAYFQQFTSSRRSRSDSLPPYACNVCGKTYMHLSSLSLHKSYHKGTTVCPICRKVCSRKYNLKLHMASVHFGRRLPNLNQAPPNNPR